MLLRSVGALILFYLFISVESTTFTFELPDGDNRCFYAVLNEKEHMSLEFQVISGGNFDVDVTLRDPNREVVKSLEREQYEYFDYIAKTKGEYELCFSNEFSSFTHKVVYMSWELESQREVPPESPLSMVDGVVYSIHENLRNAAAAQTKVRLQEASSRSFVEALNDRVTWGSIIHIVVILFVAVGQVYLLRSLFNAPSGSANASVRNRFVPTVGY